jgi:hypothetical protein
MTTPLDGPMGAIALTLLNVFGTRAKLVRQTHTRNAATGAVVITSTKYATKVIAEEQATHLTVEQLAQGDVSLLCAARGVPVVPAAVTDVLEWVGHTYQIQNVEPIRSGERVAAWRLHARR